MVHRYSALAGLLATAAATPLSIRNDANQTMVRSFKDIPPSTDLKYVPCFDNFTCANIEVPLDYDNPDVGTTNVAFMRYDAPNQPAMGDIIWNPGGPGDSAIEFMLEALEMLTFLLGDSYNIVGMDPRGVNNSGPNIDCFAGQPALRDYYLLELFNNIDPRSPILLEKYYQDSGAFGTWCSQTLNASANYANTPATATDMLHYAELLAESQGQSPEEAKVHYYGASYGSALGTTFASLYPDRVGRFIIDAVLDVEDYYFGNWSQNLLQADKAVESFFRFCYEAGPKCAFFRNDSSADSIKQRFDAMLEDLEDNPIAVTDVNFVQFPTTVTHIDFRGFLLISLYNPPALFPSLAGIAAGLENHNGTLLALATGNGVMPSAECDGTSPEVSSVQPKLLIACNDNNKRFTVTEENVTALFEYDKQLSTYVGDIWPAVIVPQCRNLDFAPPENQVFQSRSAL